MPRPGLRPGTATGSEPTETETNTVPARSTRQTRSRALMATAGRENAPKSAGTKRALQGGSPEPSSKRQAGRTRNRTTATVFTRNNGRPAEHEEDEAPRDQHFYNRINATAGAARSQAPQVGSDPPAQQLQDETQRVSNDAWDGTSGNDREIAIEVSEQNQSAASSKSKQRVDGIYEVPDDGGNNNAGRKSSRHQKAPSPELGGNGSSYEPSDEESEQLDGHESPDEEQHGPEPDLGAKDTTRVEEGVPITLNIPDTPESAKDSEAPEDEASTVGLEKLRLMLKLMGRRGWTGDNDYEDNLLRGNHESASDWQKRHGVQLGTHNLRILFDRAHRLMKVIEPIPRVPQYGEQVDYFRDKKEDIEKALNSVQRATVRVVGEMSSEEDSPDLRKRRGKAARKAICGKIMPMLTLCLKEAFLVGTNLTSDIDAPLPAEGIFIPSALDLLRLVLDWCLQLYEALAPQLDETQLRPETKDAQTALNNRRRLRTYLEHSHRTLKKARNPAEERLRRQQAIEMSEEARKRREEKAKDEREKQERQMQLVREASQRILIEDKYLKEHGWHMWEDEALRDTIEKVSNPKIETLVSLVPSRTVDEVRQRVSELRLSAMAQA